MNRLPGKKTARKLKEEKISCSVSSSREIAANLKADRSDEGTATSISSSMELADSSHIQSVVMATSESIDMNQSKIAKIELEIDALNFALESFADFIGKEEDARVAYLISQFNFMPSLKKIYRDSFDQLKHFLKLQTGKSLVIAIY